MNLLTQEQMPSRILIPKGEDNRACIDAFTTETGIVVPAFKKSQYEIELDGYTFYDVRAADIPMLLDAQSDDDMIGIAGSDVRLNYNAAGGAIRYQAIGEVLCRFALLTPVSTPVPTEQAQPIRVATSFPPLLRYLAAEDGLDVMPVQASGRIEIMPKLLGVTMVADIVATGNTARAQGLVEKKNLLNIRTEILRSGLSKEQPVTTSDISNIDATLQRRSGQIGDKTANSYTLNLLRDKNKAGKKAGEETSEVAMAIYGDGTAEECTGEIADLLYAQLVAARSCGKVVELEKVLGTLVARNKN